MNIKRAHYVAIMWKNRVTSNPPKINPCEYGWDRNKGDKSLRPTILPAGIKIEPDEIQKTTHVLLLPRAKQTTAAASVLD